MAVDFSLKSSHAFSHIFGKHTAYMRKMSVLNNLTQLPSGKSTGSKNKTSSSVKLFTRSIQVELLRFLYRRKQVRSERLCEVTWINLLGFDP